MILVNALRFASILAIVTIPGWASVLYSNGPVDGTIGGAPAYDTLSTSDSFVLSSASTVTGISNVGVWVLAGDTLTTLSWMVSSASGGTGTIEGSGTNVSPANVTELIPTGNYGSGGVFNVYSVDFAGLNLNLAAGTHYLTLFNGVPSTATHPVYWDDNGGPSSAAIYRNGNFDQSTPSNSFRIDGAASTPEPASMGVFVAGIAAIVVRRRIRGRRTVHVR